MKYEQLNEVYKLLEKVQVIEPKINYLSKSPIFKKSSLYKGESHGARILMNHVSESSYVHYRFHIDTPSGRSIDVFMSTPRVNVKNISKYVRIIWMWFNVVEHFRGVDSKCSKHLNIYILHTPFKKVLPKKRFQTLDVLHCNTAFTYSCIEENEIVIFREEEWFKVLIHETIHAFGCDFGDYQFDEIHRLFKGLQHCNNIRSNEAYTETSAIMIHCVFKAFLDDTNPKMIPKYIQLEQIWSAYQCIKVLRHYGITYNELIHGYTDNNTHRYIEANSSPFSYYILKCVLLIHADDFQTTFRLSGLYNTSSQFVNFVVKRYNTRHFHKALSSFPYHEFSDLRQDKANPSCLAEIKEHDERETTLRLGNLLLHYIKGRHVDRI